MVFHTWCLTLGVEVPTSIKVPNEQDLWDKREWKRALSSSDRVVKYDLVAVLVHNKGPSPHGGHWWAFLYDRKRKRWLLCDDATVVVFPESYVPQEPWKGKAGKEGMVVGVYYERHRGEFVDLNQPMSVTVSLKERLTEVTIGVNASGAVISTCVCVCVCVCACVCDGTGVSGSVG